MKILVAAPLAAQDKTWKDFSFTNPAEWLRLGLPCCSSTACGCRRSMTGMDSQKGTTVFEVQDSDTSIENYAKLYTNSIRKSGFPFTDEEINEDVTEMLRYASFFDVGATVRLTRSGKSIRAA